MLNKTDLGQPGVRASVVLEAFPRSVIFFSLLIMSTEPSGHHLETAAAYTVTNLLASDHSFLSSDEF